LAGVGFVFFSLLFAWFTPVHKKLYKEMFFSGCLGGGISGAMMMRYKMIYYKEVNDAYYELSERFHKFP